MAPLDVSVVAGGWSVRRLNLNRIFGYVIAVNDSALLLPNWHACVSMDRLWVEHRLRAVVDRITYWNTTPDVHVRRSALQNFSPAQISEWPWVRSFACDHETCEFSDAPRQLNGTHSGACALNLAYQLAPRRIFLLGFDMGRDPKTGDAYWYPPYPWVRRDGNTSAGRYRAWATNLERTAADFARLGIDAYLVTEAATIKGFNRLTPKQYEAIKS